MTMNDAFVTVVIPAYQAAATIARPINSLLRQSRRPDEILVVDDGSPDDLRGAVEPFGNAVTLIRKPNGGAASARNLGIEHAAGDWIAFLDADDYWEPAKLETQLEIARTHPTANIIGSRWFDERPGFPREFVPSKDDACFGRLLSATGADAFRIAMNMWTSTLLVKREALTSQRFVPGLEPAEDRDLWVRLAARNSVFLHPEPLATYVQEPGSLSRSNVDRGCGNMLRVVHRHADILGARDVRRREADVYRRWAAGHLSSGNGVAALGPAGRRLVRDPLSLQAWWVVGKSLTVAARRKAA
jgi:glycosyltransferase involved in cell wall biosynthesis